MREHADLLISFEEIIIIIQVKFSIRLGAAPSEQQKNMSLYMRKIVVRIPVLNKSKGF
jgi:hypothetical protein